MIYLGERGKRSMLVVRREFGVFSFVIGGRASRGAMELLQCRSFLIDQLIEFAFDRPAMFGELPSVLVFQSIEIVLSLFQQLRDRLRRSARRH